MKPFEGITIIEFSTMITASLAAMMMGEQGARVIKVEPTDTGDPMRYIGTAKGGISSLFANCNRGKESIRINIKDDQGQALIQEMTRSVDILIHNFRPGVMDRFNLGSDQLRAENPRLIYMAISGFGSEGPLRDAPAYDPVIQAHSGMTAAQGAGSHEFIRNLMCDKMTAYTAWQAITSGLYVRERTGEGQHIDLSMLDASMAFLFPDAYQNHTLLDEDIELQPLLSDLLYQLTVTSDGALNMAAATDRQRQGVLRALGKESLMDDPRFNTLESLMANFKEYSAIMKEAFLELSTEEALEKLKANDVPCARCHTLDEVLAQPQVAANNSIEVRQHPLMGRMRVIKSPARFAGEALEPGGHCPAHGEHTDDVLASMGIDAARVESLKASGVVS
ncbi:MAG: CoA transferase [Haliea sp.]|jgi:crotonobetainyl-CoA:carnitine CoA-transferase CaiB-like acyl-CoA transferase|nr:CoA transferase [Haliea sp.]